MKRYGNLYAKIYDMENLKRAYANAKKGKESYIEVQKIESDITKHLLELQEMFRTHSYRTSEYDVFYKQEGDKLRKIYKLPFYPDRIAQWAIMQVIEPYLIKTLIADTYSSIPKRGIHKGLKKLTHALKYHPEDTQYCLKIDIRHYYQSINHAIMKQKFRKLFKDKELLALLDEIVDSVNTADTEDLTALYGDLKNADLNTGVPIGNYLSQYCGNIYLSEFDHWMKECKCRKYYYRYMDDVVILGKTKAELHELKQEIANYLYKNLLVKIKDNWQIFPSCVRGIDFLGYRSFGSYTLLRKRTVKRMKKTLTYILAKCETYGEMNYSNFCTISSYQGWLMHCNNWRLTRKYMIPVLGYKAQYYEKYILMQGGTKNDQSWNGTVNHQA